MQTAQKCRTQSLGHSTPILIFCLPFAQVGTRSISAVAVKGGLVYLLVASASEKQWKQYEGDLKTAVATFRA